MYLVLMKPENFKTLNILPEKILTTSCQSRLGLMTRLHKVRNNRGRHMLTSKFPVSNKNSEGDIYKIGSDTHHTKNLPHEFETVSGPMLRKYYTGNGVI